MLPGVGPGFRTLRLRLPACVPLRGFLDTTTCSSGASEVSGTGKTKNPAADTKDKGGHGSSPDEKGAAGSVNSKSSWFSRVLTGFPDLQNAQHQNYSSQLTTSTFLYELVTHDVKPGEGERYLEVYKDYVTAYRKASPEVELLGSWNVFYPKRDRAIHLWKHKNGFSDIDRFIRVVSQTEFVKAADREVGLLLNERENIFMKSFGYWGEPRPREASHIYDLRIYSLRPGTMIEWAYAWAKGISYRRNANQDVGGFFSRVGTLSMVYHIWAYPDLVSRNITRNEMWSKPGWDQTVAHTVKLMRKMESYILVPTELSQLK